VDEIASIGYFSCPHCDRKKTLADEVTDFTGDQEAASSAAISVHHHSASAQSSGKQKRRGFKSNDSAKCGQEMITLNQGNNVVSRVSYRSHYEEKRAEFSMLLEKKEILELEWTKRKEMYCESKAAFTAAQQKVTVLEEEGKKIENDVNRLVGFIRSVKIWTEIIDPDEDHPVPRKAVTVKAEHSTAATILPAPTTTTTSILPSVSITGIKAEPQQDKKNDKTGISILPMNNNYVDSGSSQKRHQEDHQNNSNGNNNRSSESNGILSIGKSASLDETLAPALP